MGIKHLLCEENRPLSAKINVYSVFSRYNAEIKQPKMCAVYTKHHVAHLKALLFHILPPES